MDPYITEALVHARIEELRREAALRRRFASRRAAAPRGQVVSRLRAWTATHLALARTDACPACCPA